MVRSEFAETRAAEHGALIAALVEACRFCSVPRNRERVIEALGEPRYVNAPASALRMNLTWRLPSWGRGATPPWSIRMRKTRSVFPRASSWKTSASARPAS
jgi:ABC-type nitrate/sulfonate/bicarbonate transport system substrate-binding protein